MNALMFLWSLAWRELYPYEWGQGHADGRRSQVQSEYRTYSNINFCYIKSWNFFIKLNLNRWDLVFRKPQLLFLQVLVQANTCTDDCKKKHAHISTFILEWGHHHLEKKKRHWFYIMPASEDDSGLIRHLTGKHFFRLGHLKFRELDDEQVVILSAQNVKIRGAHSFSLRGPKLKLSGSRSNTNTYCIVV